MTESETVFYIKIGQKRLKNEIDSQTQMCAQMCVAIYNAPFGPWLNGKEYPFKYKSQYNHAQKPEISESEKANIWESAGKAMMTTWSQHNKEIKQRR